MKNDQDTGPATGPALAAVPGAGGLGQTDELALKFREQLDDSVYSGGEEFAAYRRGLLDAWSVLYDAGIVTRTNYR